MTAAILVSSSRSLIDRTNSQLASQLADLPTAAETETVIEHAKAKLARKGCDVIVANDVSPATGIMGGTQNTVHVVSHGGVEDWPPQSKTEVASALIERIAAAMGAKS